MKILLGVFYYFYLLAVVHHFVSFLAKRLKRFVEELVPVQFKENAKKFLQKKKKVLK